MASFCRLFLRQLFLESAKDSGIRSIFIKLMFYWRLSSCIFILFTCAVCSASIYPRHGSWKGLNLLLDPPFIHIFKFVFTLFFAVLFSDRMHGPMYSSANLFSSQVWKDASPRSFYVTACDLCTCKLEYVVQLNICRKIFGLVSSSASGRTEQKKDNLIFVIKAKIDPTV